METQPTAGDDASTPSPVRRRLWIVVVMLVVMGAVLPAIFGANPRLGAIYPHIRPYLDSWSADRHRASASSCLACHLEPGVRGVVTYPLTFYGEMFSSLSGGLIPAPPTSVPTDASCQRSGCHSLNRLTSFSGEIAADHRAHAIDAGVSCVTCHPGAGHNGQDGRFMLPPMSLCEGCHADVMDDCAYCHIGRALPVVP
ncbi:MAG: cytochrome c3 family protein [Coriobacteriia bacterium]|nr:cytochrome c3 family protein [Coriobacteriia bacterium]